jgi:hypothetical protein
MIERDSGTSVLFHAQIYLPGNLVKAKLHLTGCRTNGVAPKTHAGSKTLLIKGVTVISSAALI